MADDERLLPVLQPDVEEEDAPSCSPKIYVSNEEIALLDALRDLRRRSVELKGQMRDADRKGVSELESEIADLRARWKELSAEREKAFIRKMIMLGHLPPNHPVER